MRGEGTGEGFAGSSDTRTANLCTRIVGWVSRVGGICEGAKEEKRREAATRSREIGAA